jgi:hypothetical protein
MTTVRAEKVVRQGANNRCPTACSPCVGISLKQSVEVARVLAQ